MNTAEELEKVGTMIDSFEDVSVEDAFRVVNSAMCLKYGPMWFNDSNMGRKKEKYFPSDDEDKTPFDDMDTGK